MKYYLVFEVTLHLCFLHRQESTFYTILPTVPVCPLDKGFIIEDGKCVCPSDRGFYVDENGNCRLCPEDLGFVLTLDGRCICDPEKGYVLDRHGKCDCPLPYTRTLDGECVRKCSRFYSL